MGSGFESSQQCSSLVDCVIWVNCVLCAAERWRQGIIFFDVRWRQASKFRRIFTSGVQIFGVFADFFGVIYADTPTNGSPALDITSQLQASNDNTPCRPTNPCFQIFIDYDDDEYDTWCRLTSSTQFSIKHFAFEFLNGIKFLPSGSWFILTIQSGPSSDWTENKPHLRKQ